MMASLIEFEHFYSFASVQGGNGKPGGENDDDEDHAFGNDKDYGAGALDKPDRGNHGGEPTLYLLLTYCKVLLCIFVTNLVFQT